MGKNPDIKATILGSGTCAPSLKRSSCSALVEVGSEKIVLDCGPGVMRRLLEAGIEIFDVTHLLVSHFHPDHTGELASFIFSNKYPDSKRRKNPLTIVGGPGFHNFFSSLLNVYGEWIQLPERLLNIVELHPSEDNLTISESFRLETSPVNHRPESLAFKITGPEGSCVVYSGDTDISENLVKLATGVDLFICESALPDELKAPGHLTPSLAGEMAERAGVSLLILTHLYPECEKINIAKQCRKKYKGRLAVAEDLMEIELPITY